MPIQNESDGNTDNISHVPILTWPVWRHRLRHIDRKMTPLNIFF